MKTVEFFNRLDEGRIVEAIAEAERHTSGQIRVFVSHRKIADALSRARARFTRLGMEKTRERNAVLIYFAPRSQQFAVVGDHGVHARCGDGFWQALTAAMSETLREERFTDAVVLAVQKCGALLAEHFPGGGGENELPDEVERE